MRTALIAFAGTLLPLLAIDCAYLFGAGGSFYQRHISHLLAPSPSYLPAIIFYLIYAVGIVFFVVLPALRGEYGYTRVFLTGAFLGLLAYGAYDFTNQSSLRDWPVIVTVVDIAWGMLLTGTAAVAGYWASRLLV